ncbi:MAG: type II toxin-antitoxin system PrlF family antitoxin [Gammaproteobacteria bacterium]
MSHIHEVATVTSKGQITLPKPIRQALGIGIGGKVAFELRGSEVVVTRVDDERHEDPVITAFLALLEKDIRTGKNMTTLPQDLARTMLENLHRSAALSEEIAGDVAL